MRKRLISIILIMMMAVSFIILSSCVKDDNEEKEANNSTKNNTDKIQLWYYKSNNSKVIYSSVVSEIISNAQTYCMKNNIPLEVFGYDDKIISYEDYILKRNMASASGNMIIIEEAGYMQDIAKHHADYTKIENYNNLLSAYKDRFCIPLGLIILRFI